MRIIVWELLQWLMEAYIREGTKERDVFLVYKSQGFSRSTEWGKS